MPDSLLHNLLGQNFLALPPEVQAMHAITSPRQVHGTARIAGGKNSLAELIRRIAQLPKPANRVPVIINFSLIKNGEEWDRRFGPSRFTTRMVQQGPHLVEHLTQFPVSFIYRVNNDRKGFSLHPVAVHFLNIPLPRFLWPSLKARGSAWRGRYRFATVVGFWFCGRIISYYGYLEPPAA